MKKNDLQLLHTSNIEELKKRLKEAEQELFSLRLDLAQQKLKDLRALRKKRKDIARIKTIIKEKEVQHGKSF